MNAPGTVDAGICEHTLHISGKRKASKPSLPSKSSWTAEQKQGRHPQGRLAFSLRRKLAFPVASSMEKHRSSLFPLSMLPCLGSFWGWAPCQAGPGAVQGGALVAPGGRALTLRPPGGRVGELPRIHQAGCCCTGLDAQRLS